MRIHRFAGLAMTAALASLATPAIGSASPSSDAINTVKLAINAMNKGNMDAFVAPCDSPAVVIDRFARISPVERPVAPIGGTREHKAPRGLGVLVAG